VSPLPGVHSKNVLASSPSSPNHYRGPFTKWGVDFVDCNPTSAGGHQHIIVVIDYFTKWVEAMPTMKSDGKTAAFFVFNQIIARFGIPSEIVTDHGSHFQNEMMEELASKMGFRHGHSSPYYPQGKWASRGHQQVSQDHFAKNCQSE
jgi:hypothetical protein